MSFETDPLLVVVASDPPKSQGPSNDEIRPRVETVGWKMVVLSSIVGFGVGGAIVWWGSGNRSINPKSVVRGGFHASSKRTSTPLSSPKYSATQFISFSINTLGGMEEFGECEGRLVDQDDGLCYLGNPNDLQDDLNHRFNILQEVLLTIKEDALLEQPEVDHSPHVLKIFMLPEFYLRGPHGAYSAKELFRGKDALLIAMADRVRDLVADDAFEDFLFVLGTVVMADSESSTWMNATATSSTNTATQQSLDKGDILYFNFAPVYRGGTMHVDERYLVPKNYISSADFLNRAQGLPDPRNSHLVEYNAFGSDLNTFLVQQRKLHVLRNGILDVDGVRIGIEICLDHRLGVLWRHLQDAYGTVNHETGKVQVDDKWLVDVHLITSAGMAIERGPTPVRPGGVVYLTDGGASSAACLRTDNAPYDPSVVCRDRHNDGPTGLRHVPIGGEGYSSYIELATCLNPDDAPWKSMMKGYYSDHATQGCAYTLKIHGIDVFDEQKDDSYPPSIEIYPTVDLPH